MSGRVASFTVFDTGWPELKSSKWSPPTSRETKTACLPLAEVLLPDHPRHGRAARLERAGGDARVLRVAAGDRVERARVLGVLALGAVAEAVRARGVEDVGLAGRSVPDRDPMEATVGRAVRDDLGREDHVVARGARRSGVGILLVPHDPRDGVVRTGERDVRLDARAGRVDVERGIAAVGRESGRSGSADRVRPAASRTRSRRSRPWASSRPGTPFPERPASRAFATKICRSVVSSFGDAVVLLPGDPGNRIVARDGGAARDRGVLGRAKGVDVERREMDRAAALAGGQPDVGRRVEAAGEDVRRPPERPRSARTTRPTGPCVPHRRSRSTALRPPRSGRC